MATLSDNSNKKKVLYLFPGNAENIISGVEVLICNITKFVDSKYLQIDMLKLSNKENKELQKKVEFLGGIYFDLNINYYGVIGKIRLFKAIIMFFKSHVYDCIHIHCSAPVTQVVILMAAKIMGIRQRISHPHAVLLPGCKLKKFLYAFCRKIIQWVATDYFTCSTNAAYSIFPRNLVNSGTIKQINNGIIPEKFLYNTKIRNEYRKKFRLSHTFAIGLIGHISEVKNQIFAIDIVNELRKMGVDSSLFLIGKDCGDEYKVKMKIEELGLEGYVTFLGQRIDIPELLQAIDIIIIPSIAEGLGLVAIEAQAAGLHVIASDGVPAEAKITSLLEFLPLQSGAKIWANGLAKYSKGYERKNMYNEINMSGFNIRETAGLLQKIYSE